MNITITNDGSSPMIASIILDYLRVFVSTPFVIAVVSIVVLCLFRAEIRGLLNRVALLKWGPAEISTPQPASMDGDHAPEDSGVSGGQVVAPSSDVYASSSSPPVESLDELREQVRQLQEQLKSETSRGFYWEYRYLNYFLVPHTQRVLDWFAIHSSSTYANYEATWLPLIATSSERSMVLRALEEHGLLARSEQLIEITAKGREYLRFRAQFPPSPATAG